jgi:hypothetical protein
MNNLAGNHSTTPEIAENEPKLISPRGQVLSLQQSGCKNRPKVRRNGRKRGTPNRVTMYYRRIETRFREQGLDEIEILARIGMGRFRGRYPEGIRGWIQFRALKVLLRMCYRPPLKV